MEVGSGKREPVHKIARRFYGYPLDARLRATKLDDRTLVCSEAESLTFLLAMGDPSAMLSLREQCARRIERLLWARLLFR